MDVPDHYAVLGVKPNATHQEIKAAYRRLALETHPDRHPDNEEAEERFRVISIAYAVLSDPAKRLQYNAMRRLPQGLDLTQPITLRTARDFLGAMIGDVFGKQKRQRKRGRDVFYTLSVELAEAVLGSEHDIQFEAIGLCLDCQGTGKQPGGRPPITCTLCNGRGEVKGGSVLAPWTRCGRCNGLGQIHQDPCLKCKGMGAAHSMRTFHVRVLPGTDSGTEQVIEGQGEPGHFDGKPGDLRVTINVRAHPWLHRVERDIVCDVPISLSEAVIGTKIPVPTLSGSAFVTIPAGTSSGTRLRLRGKGVPPNKASLRPGDQILTIVVEVPSLEGLADQQAEMVDLLQKIEKLTEQYPWLLPQRTAQRKSMKSS